MKKHPRSLHMVLSDDRMLPYYRPGDLVAGSILKDYNEGIILEGDRVDTSND